jgi:superfamily II DNA or RNA helicase
MGMILTENKNDIVLRDYQQEAVSFLNDNDGKLILAMCPSSGKTETIIYYLNQQYNLNPNLKVLILPHSTNVLQMTCAGILLSLISIVLTLQIIIIVHIKV